MRILPFAFVGILVTVTQTWSQPLLPFKSERGAAAQTAPVERAESQSRWDRISVV